MRTARFQIRQALKRLAALAAAGAALLAPLAAATPALAQSHHQGGGGHGGGAARGGGWGRAPGWARGGPGGPPRGAPAPGWARGGPGGPPPAGPGWDQRRYNGYWVGGRWYFGPPQQPAYQTPGFRPGFLPWRRGSFLPPAYQGYVLDEYWRFHLRRPPFGYHWVQVGGEFLLVSVSTGLIFDVVTGG